MTRSKWIQPLSSLFKKTPKPEPTDPANDPTSLGNLAVAQKYITSDQLPEVLTQFNEVTGMMLGRFLIQKEIINDSQLKLLLLKQKVARKGEVGHDDLMAALALAEESQDRVTSEIDNLHEVTQVAAEKSGAK